eukprot:29841_1
MMSDIITFFEIVFVIFLGFVFALSYIMGAIHSDFGDPIQSAIALFRAMLGDFEFGEFADETNNNTLLFFGYAVMCIYLIIGSIVLLNLLIAMMAKTFDSIQDD